MNIHTVPWEERMTQTSGHVTGLTAAIGFNGLHGTGGMMTDAELGFRSPPIEREPLQYAGDQDGSDTDPDG